MRHAGRSLYSQSGLFPTLQSHFASSVTTLACVQFARKHISDELLIIHSKYLHRFTRTLNVNYLFRRVSHTGRVSPLFFRMVLLQTSTSGQHQWQCHVLNYGRKLQNLEWEETYVRTGGEDANSTQKAMRFERCYCPTELPNKQETPRAVQSCGPAAVGHRPASPPSARISTVTSVFFYLTLKVRVAPTLSGGKSPKRT